MVTVYAKRNQLMDFHGKNLKHQMGWSDLIQDGIRIAWHILHHSSIREVGIVFTQEMTTARAELELQGSKSRKSIVL